MIPFNYHHLYYFYTIARLGSVSKAAEELLLGQPTLSSQLKQFERYFKTKFFLREGKRLILTEEGRYVFSYAKDIFATGKEMLDGMGDLFSHKHRTRIQIGAWSFIPKAFVDALLNFILKADPKAYITVRESGPDDLIEDLKWHTLDAVLTDAPSESALDESLQNHLVGKVPIVFCAHSKLAAKIKRLPQDLDGAPMILPTSHSRVYHSLQEYFVQNRIKPEIVAEIQDVELVRRLALSGAGVAPINLFTVKNAPGKEKLTVLGSNLRAPLYDNIYLITKRRKRNHPLIPLIVGKFKLPV